MVIRKLRVRALELPQDTDETSMENLWQVMKESLLILQDEFAQLRGRRK